MVVEAEDEDFEEIDEFLQTNGFNEFVDAFKLFEKLKYQVCNQQ